MTHGSSTAFGFEPQAVVPGGRGRTGVITTPHGTISTPAFVTEYGVRPNRLYIEYLIYPKEVLAMLWAGRKGELLLALVFSLLIYSLTISFGDVGKAIVVVVMVLQIAGSSGTFPIELLPDVYQKIYHIFPFPYAIDAMRECICGLYGLTWLKNIGCLLIFGAAALLIGLWVRKPFMGLNHFMEEKLEETEML